MKSKADIAVVGLAVMGGSCYFEVKYDVQTGEIYDLSIHGEA